MSRRANFARLFGISEPIYDAEVLAIGGYERDYPYIAYGPKEMVLGAARASSWGKPIINGWFFRYLVPQMELAFAVDSVSATIPYDESAVLRTIHDEKGNRVDVD